MTTPTLGIRSNIASWTRQRGDPARALHLLEDLLPDQVRVLGAAPVHPGHPQQHRSVRGGELDQLTAHVWLAHKPLGARRFALRRADSS